MSASSDVNRRRLLKGAAAAGLAIPAAGLLQACASGSGDNGDSGTGDKTAANPLGLKNEGKIDVVVFNGGLGDEYPKFDKDLLVKKHDKVTVNLSSTQKIKTEQQPKFSTTPADLINNAGADNMSLDTLVNEGALTDLTPLLDSESWDEPGVKVKDTLLPGTIADGTFNGKPYVLNYAYTVFGMWYDDALFSKNSWTVPKTFDEFFTLAPKIKAAGFAPYIYDGKHPYYSRWPIYSWIWMAGGKQAMVDIDNLKPGAWKTAEVGAALAAVEKLVKDGHILPGSENLDHTQSQTEFFKGKAAFLPCGTWLENEMKAVIPPTFKLKITNFFGVSANDKAKGAVFAGSGENWIVPKKAANPTGGMEFLRAMLSKSGSAKFAELTHSLASRKGSGDALSSIPAVQSAGAVMGAAQGELISFKAPDWYKDFDKEGQNAIAELMAGRYTAAKFADTMEALAVKIAADSSVKKQTRS
jgi:N-acetylglucosamine transport system substrate-binding protein